MKPQRLLVIGLVLAGLVLVALLILVPRMKPSPYLSGYVEGEPLYLAASVSGTVARIQPLRCSRAISMGRAGWSPWSISNRMRLVER